jgi:Fe2+ transport system protein FeoA
MNLSDLRNQNFPQTVEVISINGPETLVERLHEIGFYKGCKLIVLGKAPLRGPLLVELNTTVLALRDEESACLLIQSL